MALIMVADDDPAFLALITEHLKSRGHQVVTVEDGVSAAEKAQDWKPHLILMDIMMPGVYGTSAYKSLESSGITRKTPVIFVTAVAVEKATKVVPEGPMTRLLLKPVDLQALDRLIGELLEGEGKPSA
ncbi:response regulator [Elusimicrobiota bacterium]